LTQVADDLLAHVMSESRAERLRIQDDAEQTGRLTDDPDLDRRVVTEIALSPTADPSAKQRATR